MRSRLRPNGILIAINGGQGRFQPLLIWLVHAFRCLITLTGRISAKANGFNPHHYLLKDLTDLPNAEFRFRRSRRTGERGTSIFITRSIGAPYLHPLKSKNAFNH